MSYEYQQCKRYVHVSCIYLKESVHAPRNITSVEDLKGLKWSYAMPSPMKGLPMQQRPREEIEAKTCHRIADLPTNETSTCHKKGSGSQWYAKTKTWQSVKKVLWFVIAPKRCCRETVSENVDLHRWLQWGCHLRNYTPWKEHSTRQEAHKSN